MPARRDRLLAGLIGALIGGLLVHFQYAGKTDFHSDFGMVWYGAKALVNGDNPYALIGPGREFDYRWPLIYPATALAAVLPLSYLSEHAAAVIFVALSSGILAFAVTGRGWYLLPLFLTDAFVSAAKLGQWSILLTAGLFLPWVSFFAIAKPQASMPILAGSESRRPLFWALAGGLALLLVSLLLMPSWPGHWLAQVKLAENMEPPIMRFGGFVLFVILLRWRRPESWLLLVLACLPQSWGWYGTLPLFTIPANLFEAIFLAGIATVGSYFGVFIMPELTTAKEFYAWMGSFIVFTVYLPAAILILRRPNTGELPAWLRIVLRVRRDELPPADGKRS